jgi:hypothetical protein
MVSSWEEAKFHYPYEICRSSFLLNGLLLAPPQLLLVLHMVLRMVLGRVLALLLILALLLLL